MSTSDPSYEVRLSKCETRVHDMKQGNHAARMRAFEAQFTHAIVEDIESRMRAASYVWRMRWLERANADLRQSAFCKTFTNQL